MYEIYVLISSFNQVFQSSDSKDLHIKKKKKETKNLINYDKKKCFLSIKSAY